MRHYGRNIGAGFQILLSELSLILRLKAEPDTDAGAGPVKCWQQFLNVVQILCWNIEPDIDER